MSIAVCMMAITWAGVKPEFIERQIRILVNTWERMNAQEVYKFFEDIHPFIDGNGRVGMILYNMRNETLFTPIIPEYI